MNQNKELVIELTMLREKVKDLQVQLIDRDETIVNKDMIIEKQRVQILKILHLGSHARFRLLGLVTELEEYENGNESNSA